jgi:glutamine---fructose-6-phosphate transaminase (isomerizing)
MCGIIGYIGNRNCLNILINGLKRLEYRGYDSCGITIKNNNELITKKTKGKITNLEKITLNLKGNIGIGHTRWATHGQPNEINAHPHLDSNEEIAIVHNGIIENFESLKIFLEKKGVKFKSETDSEVIAHMIKYFYKDDLKEAVIKTLKQVIGTYGLAIINKEKNEIITAKKGSPIIIGIGKKEFFIASDISAIIEYTKDIIYLEDNEIASINVNEYSISNINNNEKIEKEIINVKLSLEQIEKKEYEHFMLKEIFEQPHTLKDAILGRIDYENNTTKLGGIEINLEKDYLEKLTRIIIVACGTSYHCAITVKYFMEKYLKIPIDVDFASEFRYKNPIINKNNLVIVISQSGETADTLEALREAKQKNVNVLGIVNVVGSTIARECDFGIFTRAGPEIGVASTKSFTNQLMSLYLLTLYIGKITNKINDIDSKKIIENIAKIPNLIKIVLNENEKIKEIAKKYYNTKDILYIGRGINYPIALEGALKLKEISYIHAEGLAAGEMKHGHIALIEKNIPVVAIANKGINYSKMVSNIHEAKTRNAKIIAITTKNNEELNKISDDIIFVPDIDIDYTPFINVVCLQLLAYHIANFKKCEIDQPRNLAKSVTVE